jgi:methionyl-tRNA formyltransferase
MNIVLITSNHLRHRAFLKRMCEALPIKWAVIESKTQDNHELQDKEREYFNNLIDWTPPINLIGALKGEVNSDFVANNLRNIKPDLILTFGCSLLKKKIFSIPRLGCVNIHTGLVQHYRGVDSSFWAINEESPEKIGSTIHFINKTIDAGDIIIQTKPELFVTDDLQDIFLKNCVSSFEGLLLGVSKVKEKDDPVKLIDKGKLFQLKDMNSGVYEETKEKTSRVMQEYFLDKKSRDKKVELIVC